jgi:transposase InsO family protein
MLTVIEEFTRRCMAIAVARRMRSDDILNCLAWLFGEHGPPDHVRSDNGGEFTARAVRDWLDRIGEELPFIEPGSPWENGYTESVVGTLRDALLNGEIFYTLKEAQVLIEAWQRHDDTIRPHSSLGYRPPEPETRTPGRPDPAFAIDGLQLDRTVPVGATPIQTSVS